MYGMLRKLPSSHHYLATLFTKLLQTADPPLDWSSSIVSLIHKSGSTDDPKNFRMIALTSCVGKLHHQILAERVENFAVQNGLINPNMQKAFLRGVSGCIENNQVLHELLSHAKAKNKTLHVTFFDLQDAFGSIEHDLIHYVLEYYSFPIELRTYVKNLYSRLDGEVRGPQWSTSKFEFHRGVFQGDPLSPIIFLLPVEIADDRGDAIILSSTGDETGSSVLYMLKWSEMTCSYVHQTQGVTIGKTKTKIKGILKEEQKDYWRSKVAPLVFQGDFLKLVELEKGDLTWRSLIFNLPKGVLSFITRAAINALPTADNLSRWGKRLNTRCTLCGNHETLLHILNNCKSALEQGRYNYRHDSILQYLVSFIGKVKPDKVICHADLPGHDINGGTVPSDLTPTSERPDIVLVNQSSKSVVIGELTVPFESNIDSAHNRKSEKYASLVLDIENQGYSCELICFEVGSRGLVTKENKRQVTKLFKF
ncbi:uncharacterized protein, partial [Diadema antillarum]|uniref:uncharacterized protein n=1 Tax=Diadema antillarum TaxID=105358 RepID=UPI003A8BA292